MEDSTPGRGPCTWMLVTVLIVTILLGCNQDRPKSQQAGRMTSKTIQQVQEEHTNEWMAIPGVVGTAIGQQNGRPCIFVLTASDTEQVRRQIPSVVEGYPVVVQYVGEIRALDK